MRLTTASKNQSATRASTTTCPSMCPFHGIALTSDCARTLFPEVTRLRFWAFSQISRKPVTLTAAWNLLRYDALSCLWKGRRSHFCWPNQREAQPRWTSNGLSCCAPTELRSAFCSKRMQRLGSLRKRTEKLSNSVRALWQRKKHVLECYRIKLPAGVPCFLTDGWCSSSSTDFSPVRGHKHVRFFSLISGRTITP